MTPTQSILMVILTLGILLGWLLRQVQQQRTTSNRVWNLFAVIFGAWGITWLIDQLLSR